MNNQMVGSSGLRRIRILGVTMKERDKRFVVYSATDARRHYVVLRKVGGKWMCSCPRWIFGIKQPDGTRRRENCKHILFLKLAA